MESSPENVKQLIFFLVDKSGSMSSFFDDSSSRYDASMKLISNFVRKSEEIGVRSQFGSILFNNTLEVRNELTSNCDEFLQNLIIEADKPFGGTALFHAIEKAANLLIKANENNKYPNAVLRIIVFSDGLDVY